MSKQNSICPCCSGEKYDTCCKPFHQGQLPATALQLMRSRYSAYALKLADYIIATTHPDNREYKENIEAWKASIMEFSENSQFEKLEILGWKDGEKFATVSFVVSLTQQGHKVIFTEKSLFEKVEGKWLYKNGEFAQGRVPSLI